MRSTFVNMLAIGIGLIAASSIFNAEIVISENLKQQLQADPPNEAVDKSEKYFLQQCPNRKKPACGRLRDGTLRTYLNSCWLLSGGAKTIAEGVCGLICRASKKESLGKLPVIRANHANISCDNDVLPDDDWDSAPVIQNTANRSMTIMLSDADDLPSNEIAAKLWYQVDEETILPGSVTCDNAHVDVITVIRQNKRLQYTQIKFRDTDKCNLEVTFNLEGIKIQYSAILEKNFDDYELSEGVIKGGNFGGWFEGDRERPAVEIYRVPQVRATNAPFPVTIKFSEPVFGFEERDIYVDKCTPKCDVDSFEGTDNDHIFYARITPTQNDTIEISVLDNAAKDASGNFNIASIVYKSAIGQDLVRPFPVISGVPLTRLGNGAFPITVTFLEPVFGFTKEDIFVSHCPGASCISNFLGQDGDKTFTARITPQSVLEQITVKILGNRFRDEVGNPNAPSEEHKSIYAPIPDSWPDSCKRIGDCFKCAGVLRPMCPIRPQE